MNKINELRNKTLRKILRIIEKRASMGECNYFGEISDWLEAALKSKGFQVESGGYSGIYKKVIW